MSNCPDNSQLQEFLVGKLKGLQFEQMSEHLLRCRECLRNVDALATQDVWLEALSFRLPIEEDGLGVSDLVERCRKIAGNVETLFNRDTTHGIIDERVDISFLKPPILDDEIGRLGGYRVLGLLGSGGMGVVFLAEDPVLKRRVALKAIKSKILANDTSHDRFIGEARAVAAIEHDNIVQVFQVGEDDGVPFIAMQLLQGESLQEKLNRSGRLGEEEAIRIGIEVAEGLNAAHQLGMIHRDIKPENLWLEAETDRVKILDFGLAHRIVEDESEITHDGKILGTPRYMSPEQVEGRKISPKSDLFSLGCVLYRMVTGAPPFDGNSMTGTLISVARDEPRPVHQFVRKLNPHLAGLITSLLAKDPQKRPETAAAVSENLKSIGNRTSISFRLQSMSQFGRRSLVFLIPSIVLILAIGFLFSPRVSEFLFAREHQIYESETGNIEFNLWHDYQEFIHSSTNARQFTEANQITYWTPTKSGEWGEVIFKFPLPKSIKHCRMYSQVNCYFEQDPEAEAEILVSVDGEQWEKRVDIQLPAEMKSREASQDYTGTFNGWRDLTELVEGHNELFVKARLRAVKILGDDKTGVDWGPNGAQFLRSDTETYKALPFRLRFDIETPDQVRSSN